MKSPNIRKDVSSQPPASLEETHELLANVRIEEPYKRQVWTKRYGNALKQMAPVRPSQKDDGHVMPGPSRGFLSLFSLHWLTPHMWKAFRGTLSTNDLWNLRSEDTCQANCDRLERHWQDEVARKGPKNASLSSVLLRTFRARIVFSCFFMVLGVMFQFVGPSILLASMMRYVNDASATYSQGLQLFGLIVLCQLARTYCCYGLSTVTATFATFRASGALQLMVYRKVIRLSSASDQILGKVVNICVSDMDRVFDAFTAGPLMFSAIGMFVFALVFSILIVGPWCLLGFILILLCYPLLGSMAAVSSHLRLKVVKCTDRRINLMSEILAAIRLIKTYAWEDSFKKTVFAVRAEEHAILQRMAFLQSTSSTISPIIGVLAAMSTILGYILSGNKLSPEAAFATVAVFNAMQFSIGTLPYGIKMVTEVHVALRRIQRMLLLDDIAEPDIALSVDSALQIEQGTFAWEKTFIEKKGKEEKGVKDKSSSKKSLPSVETNGSIVDCADISRNSSVASVPGLNGDAAEKVACNGVEKTDALDAENQTELVETLHNIDLSLARGRLVGVAGSVGAGKTSLLLAITGQLRKMSGRVRYSGSLAVASQTAWIFGGTLRDNILFGSKLDEDKYGRALDVCALRSDLKLLEHGDNTEIGERGVNLSGGQKQRVSLARAVYAEADIYLLDDPLSAVDARVGKHIFEQCILGELADRTVLLVSHGVQYLSRCDEVLMMKEGRLVERGTHAELIARRGEYFKLISYDTSVESEAHHVNSESSPHSKSAEDGERVGESRDSGPAEEHQLKKGFFRLLLAYCRACGGCAMLLVLALVVMFGVGRSANAIYLQYWLDQGDGLQEERLKNITNSNTTYTKSEITGFINDNADLTQHVAIYCMISVVFILLGLVKGLGVALRVIKGATKVHDDMFEGLMRCKMSFFDQNPAGRILNRFSRDMDELDNKIPMLLEFLLQGAFIILVQFIVPVAAFPPITILLVFVSFVYSMLARGLVASIRETKHVENLVRSPVIHHITSTISGLPIIRAFKRQHIFSKRFEDLLDRHTSANMEFRLASVWYSMRVEEVSNIVMSVVTLFLVFYRSISPAAAGLVLTSVYGWITFLSFWMRMITELGARLTSVERCEQYINSLDYEAAAHVPDSPAADGTQCKWPSAGAVELRGVCLRYRPELPRVLHDVSVKIRAGEKVGVVGRTGAGKSTLISTLLRMVELEQGQVLVDGVDVAKVGLHQLRSSIDVIPQDPILFSGTVRYNLDPFGQYEDDRLWDVLEKANLKRKIGRAKKQLEMKVSSDGDNFSVGEKQLMCLARALLRRNRILLLDEATASVDIETDHLIQSTIRRNFELCTVLTIAHRLNTVVSYDRVLVMDAGRVCEFDSPLALMAREGSLFRQMMSDSGVHTDDQLKQMQNNQLNRAVL